MKAVRFDEYGESNVMKVVDLEKPVPGDGQVLIRVEKVGMNFADMMRRRNQYLQPTPLPFIPGYEVAGIVEESGPNCTLQKGERVAALLLSGGGYSEYVIADEADVSVVPEEVSLEDAVSVLLQGLTAYYMMKEMARIQEGESVLVHAAAGGVGTLAVQLAKLLGAGKVIATSSTDEKLERAKSLGADTLINYTEEDWHQQVLSATNGKGVDIVLEMAGDEVFYQSLKSLAPFGRIIVYGRASRIETLFDPRLLMKRNQIVAGFFLGNWTDAKQNKKTTELLFDYIKNGDLSVQIGGSYPLEEAGKVQDLMEARRTEGKQILTTN